MNDARKIKGGNPDLPEEVANRNEKDLKKQLDLFINYVGKEIKEEIDEDDNTGDIISIIKRKVGEKTNRFMRAGIELAISIAERTAKFSQKEADDNIHIIAEKVLKVYGSKESVRIMNVLFQKGRNKEYDKKINSLIKKSINDNMRLIKTLPETIKERMIANAIDASLKGELITQGIEKIIEESSKLPLYRAQLIAKNQTFRLNSDLTKHIMQASSIDSYEWIHTGISKEPRPMHVALDGTIHKWSEPPIASPTGERANPQEMINCTCIARPVFIIDKKRGG